MSAANVPTIWLEPLNLVICSAAERRSERNYRWMSTILMRSTLPMVQAVVPAIYPSLYVTSIFQNTHNHCLRPRINTYRHIRPNGGSREVKPTRLDMVFAWSRYDHKAWVSSPDERPTPENISRAISVDSDTRQNPLLSSDRMDVVQLPTPFYPPSLVQQNPVYGVRRVAPRGLPSSLGLPPIPDKEANSEIDPRDSGGPDGWIPRDSRLVRLTGKHPFNAEANLRDLYAQGFITPSNLFYVRNHGPVPFIDQNKANEWTVKFHGLCSNPKTLSLADLRTMFRVVTIPITIVCAGNRRKEQNVVQKSLGFAWGPGVLSTALFTGVYLADVLDFIQPTRQAKHVIFEGCDDLPNGPYGTSQLTSWARDKRKGMILAWAMNGLPLEPDHGFPLRLVVPAQVGGRSVKWLSRIELSTIESQHHLHFYDNKVLPMALGADQARAEKKWWYDRNTIACPDHDEILETADLPQDATYTLKGYAYAGGGRRVTRVEISSDDGTTWNLANVDYPEDRFREVVYFDPVYGNLDMTDSDTCFCWCFWSFDIEISVLKASEAIMVRCMDESIALQPRDMYWNANATVVEPAEVLRVFEIRWFRVCIQQLEGGKLRFEHPTSKFPVHPFVAGTQPGGWMQRLKDEGLDPAKPNFSADSAKPSTPKKELSKPAEIIMTKEGVDRKISIEELASPVAKEQAWFVVRGEVYNGSRFFNDHPGNAESIKLVAGEDATEDFLAIHSLNAQRQLADFHIGTLVGAHSSKEVGDGEASGSFLQPKTWKPVRLSRIEDVSKDAKVFRFQLTSAEQELGLPFGQHVYVRLRRKVTNKERGEIVQGELVQRAYTPLSERNAKGFIDLLIKIYYPSAEFPQGGRMTVGFSQLVVGDSVELKGPIGHFIWKGNGIASLHGEERRIAEIGLICGGSGVTPILQVLRAILTDPTGLHTKVWVLDVNRYLDDILCREELDRLALEHGPHFKLHYSLTGKPLPDDWPYSTGRITDEMLVSHLPVPGTDALVCVCGPPQMEESVKAALKRTGWEPPKQVVLF
ncbi:hypothetical protein M413DRAFT_13248 [Hebeloma cylindrosporum]|uniref:Nitrate reductase [NADPH] n=1 Tax=Hebeloma cylindrosporum TaxID=76867 RepID=A0A0C3BZS3_HEBCY|nr:hypothetical protein M413DRAFT_13248 [Hebeloma cylindrosporum h7]